MNININTVATKMDLDPNIKPTNKLANRNKKLQNFLFLFTKTRLNAIPATFIFVNNATSK